MKNHGLVLARAAILIAENEEAKVMLCTQIMPSGPGALHVIQPGQAGGWHHPHLVSGRTEK